jgi:tetratricopeptide (TPR) repeat protein
LESAQQPTRAGILQQMLDADPRNSFARYGLAMEYVKSNAFDKAMAEFNTLLQNDPNYSAAYFHGGQTFEKMGDLDGARDFYRRGLAVTKDPHARGELQASLDILGD